MEVASSLGELAVLLAFTFCLAANALQVKCEAMLGKTKPIGTEHLRLALLSGEARLAARVARNSSGSGRSENFATVDRSEDIHVCAA